MDRLMTYREETHSKECYGRVLMMVIKNASELEEQYYSAIDFRLSTQNNSWMYEADALLDPQQVGRDALDSCTCEVKGSMVFDLGLMDYNDEAGFWEYRKTGLTQAQIDRLEARIVQFAADELEAQQESDAIHAEYIESLRD